MARANNSTDLHQRRSALPIIVAVAGDMQVQQAAAQVLVANADQVSPRNYQMLAGHQRTDNMIFFLAGGLYGQTRRCSATLCVY
jgi:hypothetical protein